MKKIDWFFWSFKTFGISFLLIGSFVLIYAGIISISERRFVTSILSDIFSNVGFDIILVLVTLILIGSIGFLEYLRIKNRY